MTMFFTHIMTAFQQFQKNKGRAILTMLGIVIGIGSVIFILTMGEIAKNFLLSQITKFGTNVIEISTAESIMTGGTGNKLSLTDADAEALENSSLLPEISAISAGYTAMESIERNNKQWSAMVMGDRPEVFVVNHIKVLEGRLFAKSDVDNRTKVLVIGEKLANNMFPSGSAINKAVKLGGETFHVIGVTEDISFGMNMGGEMVYAPISTVRQLFADAKDSKTLSYLMVAFNPGSSVESLKNRIEFELKKTHGLLGEKDKDKKSFLIMSREQFLDIFDSILLGIQLFVSAVAAISLLVGGIGIMNIMLVTVEERTKEIGLRKAIGAKQGSILAQFLIESIVLTIIGGVIGISLGIGLCGVSVYAVNVFAPTWGVQFIFVPSAIVIACAVAVVIGIIFGSYPAYKASKLHPIDALRYE